MKRITVFVDAILYIIYSHTGGRLWHCRWMTSILISWSLWDFFYSISLLPLSLPHLLFPYLAVPQDHLHSNLNSTKVSSSHLISSHLPSSHLWAFHLLSSDLYCYNLCSSYFITYISSSPWRFLQLRKQTSKQANRQFKQTDRQTIKQINKRTNN